jgi:hypothetical protein
MPDERSALDAQLLALDERLERLRRAHPAPSPAPPPVLPKRSPLATARTILALFIWAAASLLVGDVAILFRPDPYVFVSREGHNLQVWESVQAYEAATGKKWIEQPPRTVKLLATYHGAAWSQALNSVGWHILFLVLSVVAFRAVRRLREDASAEPIAPSDRPRD